MYPHLLATHSWLRWLLLISLLLALITAWQGWRSGRSYHKTDNLARLFTTIFAHTQLLVGFILYFVSPVVKIFLSDTKQAINDLQLTFFGILHLALMLIAVIIITVGSSLSKKATTDQQRFRTIFIYFLAALIIIFIAVPWPFSPLAARPWIRTF
ncbi:MAG: hypothetical protein ACK4TA_06460 [Saprospiraceae bacterium]